MTRRIVIALLCAAAPVAALVAGSQAQDSAVTLDVGPGQAGEKTTPDVMRAGKRYRVTIEGTMKRTATDQPHEFDAFWCFSCPDIHDSILYQSYGINVVPDDGESRDPYAFAPPERYMKAGRPAYNPEHRYVLIFDDIEASRKLIFQVRTPQHDSSGYAGTFTVTIEPLDPPPKQCTVGRYSRNPNDGQVAWLFTQGGPPVRRPATLKESVTVGRGVARIGKRASRRGRNYELSRARGEICHEDRYGATDPDPPHRELDFGSERLKLKMTDGISMKDERGTGEVLSFAVEVVESDDPSCEVGWTGLLYLVDGKRRSKDSVTLGPFAEGGCHGHEHKYRNVLVVINPDHPGPPS